MELTTLDLLNKRMLENLTTKNTLAAHHAHDSVNMMYLSRQQSNISFDQKLDQIEARFNVLALENRTHS